MGTHSFLFVLVWLLAQDLFSKDCQYLNEICVYTTDMWPLTYGLFFCFISLIVFVPFCSFVSMKEKVKVHLILFQNQDPLTASSFPVISGKKANKQEHNVWQLWVLRDIGGENSLINTVSPMSSYLKEVIGWGNRRCFIYCQNKSSISSCFSTWINEVVSHSQGNSLQCLP